MDEDREAHIFDVYTSPNLHVMARIYDPSAPLCVAFASGGKTREHAGDQMAAKYGFNLISIATKEMDWFQYPDLPEAEAAIREVAAGFPRVMAYGFSMGAYGALISSAAIGADVVLACSPQAAMGPNCPPREFRWADDRARIKSEFGFIHDNMDERLTRTGEVIVMYDPLDEDVDHVRMIEKIRPIAKIVFPLAAHNTLPLLAPIGLASKLVRDVLYDRLDLSAFQNEIHRARRQSLRIDGLTAALAKRNRRIPESVLRLLATDPRPVPLSRLRASAQQAAKSNYADTLVALLQRMLADRSFLMDANFIPEVTTYVKVASQSPDVVDLIVSLMQRVDTTEDRNLNLSRLLAIVKLEMARGNMTDALAKLKRAAGLVTAWDKVNSTLAALFSKLGDQDASRQFARRLEVRTGPDFSSIELVARVHEREQNWEAAVTVWTEAAQLGVSPSRVAVRLARALVRLGRYEHALQAVDVGLQAEFPSPEILKIAGSSLSKLKRETEALPHFQRAVDAAPMEAGGHRLLSNSYSSLGQFAKALEHAEIAQGLRPSDGARAHVERLKVILGRGSAA